MHIISNMYQFTHISFNITGMIETEEINYYDEEHEVPLGIIIEGGSSAEVG